MCKLTKEVGDGPFEGWKIVVEKEDGKYYSAAMGFCYNDYEKIPEVKEQKRIIKCFMDDILDSWSNGFSYEMIGRSAIFVEKESANAELNRILWELVYLGSFSLVNENMELKVVKTRVSDSVYEGYYGFDKVLAGRKLEFLE